MGAHAQRIRLSDAVFNLCPPSLTGTDLIDLGGMRLQQMYSECHAAVFGDVDTRSVTLYEPGIMRNARQCKLPLKLYLLCAMVAGKEQSRLVTEQGSEPLHFHPSKLAENGMIARASVYAKSCRIKYATLTPDRIVSFSGAGDDVRPVLQSEILTGDFIVRWKALHQGQPYTALYAALETKLDPRWLAIEPHYFELVYKPYLTKRTGTEKVKAHRFRVSQARRDAKRHRAQAIYHYHCRERILPEAIVTVLRTFLFRPDQFLVAPEPVTDPMEIWIGLGRAFQQLACLDLVRSSAEQQAIQCQKQS